MYKLLFQPCYSIHEISQMRKVCHHGHAPENKCMGNKRETIKQQALMLYSVTTSLARVERFGRCRSEFYKMEYVKRNGFTNQHYIR